MKKDFDQQKDELMKEIRSVLSDVEDLYNSGVDAGTEEAKALKVKLQDKLNAAKAKFTDFEHDSCGDPGWVQVVCIAMRTGWLVSRAMIGEKEQVMAFSSRMVCRSPLLIESKDLWVSEPSAIRIVPRPPWRISLTASSASVTRSVCGERLDNATPAHAPRRTSSPPPRRQGSWMASMSRAARWAPSSGRSTWSRRTMNSSPL